MSSKPLTLFRCDVAGWATVTGDIDYSVKLVFSDDEEETGAMKSSSGGSKTAPTRERDSQ